MKTKESMCAQNIGLSGLMLFCAATSLTLEEGAGPKSSFLWLVTLTISYSKCSKISNTSWLPKQPKQTVQTHIRLTAV